MSKRKKQSRISIALETSGLNQGFKAGEITAFIVGPSQGKSMSNTYFENKILFINEEQNLRHIENNTSINEIEKYIKEHNIGMKEPIITKYEKIGDIVYPVIYWPDGLITVDYPRNKI